MGTVAAGEGFPVAILNRNEPAFYCVPAEAYEALMDRLEELELNALADARLKDGVQGYRRPLKSSSSAGNRSNEPVYFPAIPTCFLFSLPFTL